MGYLTTLNVALLIAAGALGLLTGWHFRGKGLMSKHAAAEGEWRKQMLGAERRRKELASCVWEKEAEIQRLRTEIGELEQDRIAFLHIQKERNDLRAELAEAKGTPQRPKAAKSLGEDEIRKTRSRPTAPENAGQIGNEKPEQCRMPSSVAEISLSDRRKSLPWSAATIAVAPAASSAASIGEADDLKKISGIGCETALKIDPLAASRKHLI